MYVLSLFRQILKYGYEFLFIVRKCFLFIDLSEADKIQLKNCAFYHDTCFWSMSVLRVKSSLVITDRLIVVKMLYEKY